MIDRHNYFGGGAGGHSVTLGAVFAGILSTSLLLFSERVGMLVNLIQQLGR